MNFSQMTSRFGKILVNHSPSILTGFAVTGAMMTAVLAGRASFRVGKDVNAGHYEPLMEGEESEFYDIKGLVKTYWREYIPAAATGAATIACIIAANQIGNRRAAAMAVAYSLADKAFEEYKEKVVEKLGEKKERAARVEMAQERVNRNPPNIDDAILIGDTMSVLCCDLFTGRYLLTDMETLRRAENDINFQVTHDYYASLSDFYDRIGLPRTSMSDDFGWNVDKMLELDFDTVLTPTGKPCLTFNFRVAPIRGYNRLQ